MDLGPLLAFIGERNPRDRVLQGVLHTVPSSHFLLGLVTMDRYFFHFNGLFSAPSLWTGQPAAGFGGGVEGVGRVPFESEQSPRKQGLVLLVISICSPDPLSVPLYTILGSRKLTAMGCINMDPLLSGFWLRLASGRAGQEDEDGRRERLGYVSPCLRAVNLSDPRAQQRGREAPLLQAQLLPGSSAVAPPPGSCKHSPLSLLE